MLYSKKYSWITTFPAACNPGNKIQLFSLLVLLNRFPRSAKCINRNHDWPTLSSEYQPNDSWDGLLRVLVATYTYVHCTGHRSAKVIFENFMYGSVWNVSLSILELCFLATLLYLLQGKTCSSILIFHVSLQLSIYRLPRDPLVK